MNAVEDLETIHAHGYGTSSMFHEHEGVPPADRYDFDAWIWSEDGELRHFDREGPVIQFDDGRRRYKYYPHKDTLQVSRSSLARASKGIGARFFMQGMLADLKDSKSGFTDLGERLRNGRPVRIVQKEVPKAKRKEWWFDLQNIK